MNLPYPPIIAYMCVNIWRANRFNYVLEDLHRKLENKTYHRREIFVRLQSWLNSLRNFIIWVWTLNLNENIYKITHDDGCQYQQLDCCFKSLFMLTTKKTSKHKINGLLWRDCDWIAVTIIIIIIITIIIIIIIIDYYYYHYYFQLSLSLLLLSLLVFLYL